MSHPQRIPLYTLAPKTLKAMIDLTSAFRHGPLGERLVELVFLRVSQMNGSGPCADMHWRELVKQGVEPRHLNAISGWRASPFFSERERAALAWAEAVNALPRSDATDAAWEQLRAHFSDADIAELVCAIATVRGWNGIHRSLRTAIPEQPLPGL